MIVNLKDILGILEFHEVARNFLEVLHEELLVVVLSESGIVCHVVHDNLLYNRSLH